MNLIHYQPPNAELNPYKERERQLREQLRKLQQSANSWKQKYESLQQKLKKEKV